MDRAVFRRCRESEKDAVLLERRDAVGDCFLSLWRRLADDPPQGLERGPLVGLEPGQVTDSIVAAAP